MKKKQHTKKTRTHSCKKLKKTTDDKGFLMEIKATCG